MSPRHAVLLALAVAGLGGGPLTAQVSVPLFDAVGEDEAGKYPDWQDSVYPVEVNLAGLALAPAFLSVELPPEGAFLAERTAFEPRAGFDGSGRPLPGSRLEDLSFRWLGDFELGPSHGATPHVVLDVDQGAVTGRLWHRYGSYELQERLDGARLVKNFCWPIPYDTVGAVDVAGSGTPLGVDVQRGGWGTIRFVAENVGPTVAGTWDINCGYRVIGRTFVEVLDDAEGVPKIEFERLSDNDCRVHGSSSVRASGPDLVTYVIVFPGEELEPGESAECEVAYRVHSRFADEELTLTWAIGGAGDNELDWNNNLVDVVFRLAAPPIPTLSPAALAILAAALAVAALALWRQVR